MAAIDDLWQRVRGEVPHRVRPEKVYPLPCAYEESVVEFCVCPNGEDKHVRGCAVHDRCTYTPVNPAVMDCKRCRAGNLGFAPAVTGPAVLVTGGIGDAITVEGIIAPAERQALTTVYYAAPAAAEIRELFEALPGYPSLEHHVVLPTGGQTLYSRREVERTVGLLTGDVRDLSVNVLFPHNPVYYGSSLLSLPPVELSDDLPEVRSPYVAVVDRSTWFAPPGREFSSNDWEGCIEVLERHDLHAVVLCRQHNPVPDHPRIVNFQGRTSLLQSIEVVRRAVGYIGIDSWVSVLASKLFPPGRMMVKYKRTHAYENRRIYYAPQTDFSFLTPRIEADRWKPI